MSVRTASSSFFIKACGRDLVAAQIWYETTAEPFPRETWEPALQSAALGGQLATVQWLVGLHPWLMYRPHIQVVLNNACTGGHLTMAQWVGERVPHAIYRGLDWAKLFALACGSGNLPLVQWVVALGGNTLLNHADGWRAACARQNSDGWKAACVHKPTDVLLWLWETQIDDDIKGEWFRWFHTSSPEKPLWMPASLNNLLMPWAEAYPPIQFVFRLSSQTATLTYRLPYDTLHLTFGATTCPVVVSHVPVSVLRVGLERGQLTCLEGNDGTDGVCLVWTHADGRTSRLFTLRAQASL